MIALSLLTAAAYQPLSTCWGTPTHWDQVTTWHITRPTNGSMYSQLSDAEVENAVHQGFEAWTQPVSCCSGFEHDNGGTVTQEYSLNDSTNVISFEESSWDWSLGSVNGTIAVTFSQWGGGCVLSSGDQVFNGVGFTFTTTSSPGWGDTDLQSIAAHENGHWLGLGHSSTGAATMYYAYPGGTSARSLHADDEAGVCNAYPATCGPQEEDCADGIDDEGDGLVDCADPDCVGYAVCTCAVDATLACGDVVSGDTYGQVSTTESWACANWQTTGPEAVYAFSSAVSGPVTVDLSDLDADMDLFVTTAGNGNNCDPDSCWSSGGPETTPESVTIDAVAGETYVVVADGWDGAESGYTLALSCPPGGNAPTGQPGPPDEPGGPDLPEPPQGPPPTCAPTADLQCNVPVAGTTAGGASEVTRFACVDWDTSGPEAVYRITPSIDGPVSVRMSGLVADLDLFVTTELNGGCAGEACVAASGESDLADEVVTFQGRAGQSYAIVADGYEGATSRFDLVATCGGSTLPGATGGIGAADASAGRRGQGCGCVTSPGAQGLPVWFGLGLVLLGIRRRQP